MESPNWNGWGSLKSMEPTKFTPEQLRNISISDVLLALECVPDHRDREKWKSPSGEVITVRDNLKVFNHALDKGGAGAIDATQLITGWAFGKTLGWLRKLARDENLQIESSRLEVAAPEEKSLALPKSDPRALREITDYLVKKRKLNPSLIEQMISDGDIYAFSHTVETTERDEYLSAVEGQTCFKTNRVLNVVFVRRNLAGEVVGAVQRGIKGDFKQTVGKKESGFFFVGNRVSPKVIAIVESPIDAISFLQSHREVDLLVMSTDGSGKPYRPLLSQFPIAEIWLAQDADATGDLMATSLAQSLGCERSTKRVRPIGGKDWNELL